MDFGINFNGDFEIEKAGRRAAEAEKLGFSHIWVGESRALIHPFPILAVLTSATYKVTMGTGIISALGNRCFHINKAFLTLKEIYGERFIAGIAPGDVHGLRVECIATKPVMKRLEYCISKIKGTVPVYIGASGPKLIELASVKAEGIILNYINPEYLKWALKHRKKRVYTVAIAPALLLPDSKNESELLYAAGVVAAGANQNFLEEHGIYEEAFEVRKKVIRNNFEALKEHKDFLLENFTLSGTYEEVFKKIKEIEKLGIDQIILSSPFNKSEKFKEVENIIRALD
ncbi:methylenetetrahydromethanopterin reductase [archaeon]|nr:methylenetetrahydromethanopterin reductase [archaeon]